MIIVDKRKFFIGSTLLIAFLVVLILMFVPMFGPKRELHFIDYAQQILNSLAKGSSYFIPQLNPLVEKYKTYNFDISIDLKREGDTPESLNKRLLLAQKVFTINQISYEFEGSKVRIKSNLGNLLKIILEDSDNLFFNRGELIKQKYDIEDEKRLFRFWHLLLTRMEKYFAFELKEFEIAKDIKSVVIKAIEPAYNYYGITPDSVRKNPLPLTLLLSWYIIYTLWYGLGTLYFFEGLGLTAKRPKSKREI